MIYDTVSVSTLGEECVSMSAFVCNVYTRVRYANIHVVTQKATNLGLGSWSNSYLPYNHGDKCCRWYSLLLSSQ